jgi:hypothetical protein
VLCQKDGQAAARWSAGTEYHHALPRGVTESGTDAQV